MPYPTFDRGRLKLRPLADRAHDVNLSDVLSLDANVPPLDSPDLVTVARRVVSAHRAGRPVILMMGAHVVKVGLSRFVIDLMARGVITHVGMNGAGPIHDFELALIGATTESVARYIQEGQFGLWQETGRLHEAIQAAAREGIGYGEAVVGGPLPDWRNARRDAVVRPAHGCLRCEHRSAVDCLPGLPAPFLEGITAGVVK